jgi:hypothetical protein
MAVLEKAGSGYNKGEQEAGGGDPVAGEPVAAAIAKALRQFLPGRLFVVQDLVRPVLRLVNQAAPFLKFICSFFGHIVFPL